MSMIRAILLFAVLFLSSCIDIPLAEKNCLRKYEVYDETQFKACVIQSAQNFVSYRDEIRIDCLYEIDVKYPDLKQTNPHKFKILEDQCLDNKGYYYVSKY